MCRRNTPQAAKSLGWLLLVPVLIAGLEAQAPQPDWRHIGNAAVDDSLAGVATGPVDRVWYSDDGSRIYARTHSGQTFVTTDLDTWSPAPAGQSTPPPEPPNSASTTVPAPNVRILGNAGDKLYAVGRFAYRSDDGGATWSNLTDYQNRSLIGPGLADLAISPRDPAVLVAATDTGVWRSADGGLSWSGLNQSLPNLDVQRLLGSPVGTQGERIAVEDGATLDALEWVPGEKQAWRSIEDADLTRELQLRQVFTRLLGTEITAVAGSGDAMYAGSADGRLWTSSDTGITWQPSGDRYPAPIERIVVDANDSELALVALGARLPGTPAGMPVPHVLRTISGGAVWDDLTANLPDAPVHGIAEDRTTGAVYVATDRGLFMTFADLQNAGPATPWHELSGLPAAPVMDARLGPGANQLYAAVEGYGVYAALAPHRFRDVRVVNAADFSSRPAAPGSLLSVLGAKVESVRSGDLVAPVLSASASKSEIQVPFAATGTSLSLALEEARGTLKLGVPLESTSPAIFVDGDGTPVLLDADSGVMLDTMTPAHSNMRLQILATGLGRVNPDWPTGMPAPTENPPRVVATVHAYLDRMPVEVTRATLAPGYVGFYLVEIQLPRIVDYGPAELYIETDGQASNRVRLWIEP
jgi:uncharacterized protein (TIGR03437 family)